jgi:sirohydrochlorin cobaltochelatase
MMGFTQVAVQSLHTIPGEEYDYLVETARASRAAQRLEKVLVGRPLLSLPDDLEKAADAMIANFPQARKVDEAVVLMGHGTPHPGNSMFRPCSNIFSSKDAYVFVGTGKASPRWMTS